MTKQYDLLILGNGFDLACGYKTAYEDFFNFLKLAYNTDKTIFLGNFNVLFPKISLDCAKVFLEKFKNLLDNDCKENIFIKYFLNYNTSLNSWVAFEKELLLIAKGFDAFFEALKNYDKFDSLFCDFSWNVKNNSEALRVFHFIDSCKFYKISEISATTTGEQLDFSIKELSSLNAIQWQIETEKYIEKFVDYIYEELSAFSELFAIYLHIVSLQEPNEIGFRFKADKIINFNYTNTYHKIFPLEVTDICYLNGSIVAEADNIVFGFNGDENLKNLGLDVLSKSSQRAYKQTDFEKLTEFLPDKRAIWSEFSIGVYGHSLDKADKDTLNMIFTASKEAKIDIYYLDDKSKKSLISNLKIILTQQKFNALYANKQIKFIPCLSLSVDEDDDLTF